MPSSCLFCRIVAGEIPSYSILETETMIAFLDIFPTSPGHTLVVPKTHTPTIMETDDALLADWIQTTKRVAQVIKTATQADGINIMQNNGEAAGQVIHHLHMHVIPRYLNDGLKHWPGHPIDKEEGKVLAERLWTTLNS